MDATQNLPVTASAVSSALVDLDALEHASPDELIAAATLLVTAAAERMADPHSSSHAQEQHDTALTAAEPVAVAALTTCHTLVGALGSPHSEAEAIDRIQRAEQLKAGLAAVQARDTAVLEQLRHNAEAERGVDKANWGKGLPAEIGLARGDSPSRGSQHLSLANALTQDLSQTYAALQTGRIHEEHAKVVATETSWLSVEHRRAVDGLIADRLGSLGPRQLADAVRGHAQTLDQPGAVERRAKAKTERRVSVRPAPEGMAYLTVLLPVEQAVASVSGCLCKCPSHSLYISDHLV